MKFIHLSDLHIGKRVNEFPMLEDQKYILKEILSIIDQEKPDGVLIAAIHRGNHVIIPNGQTMIHEDDKVTIFCLLSDIGELEKLMTIKRGLLR